MRTVALVAAAAAMAVSCGGTPAIDGEESSAIEGLESAAIGQPSVQRAVARDTSLASGSLYETVDYAGVVYAAPLVVRGVVEGVEGPFWNSADGQKWEMLLDDTEKAPADYTVPVLYREVTISIDEVLRNDYGFKGDEISIYALGGGEKSKDEDPYVGGHFTVGEEVILFTGEEIFYMRSEPIAAYQPFYLHQGVFHIADGKVVRDGQIPVFERIANPEIEDMDKPEPPELPSLNVFLSGVAEARNGGTSEWDVYRRSPEQVEGTINMVQRAVGEARSEGEQQ